MTEFDKTPQFKPTPLDSVITGRAVVIAAYDGAEVHAQGTGIFVAPRLVMTAKHIVEHFWNRLASRPRPAPGVAVSAPFAIQVLQFPGDAAVPAMWVGERAWTSSATDAAFLQVVPNGESGHAPWSGTPLLKPLPPEMGERVVGFGYPASSGRVTSLEPFTVEWGLQGHTTVGQVTAVYPERRDRGLLNFPCFETNARFDGGMSGGPIFDASGRVCGLICAALNADADGPFTSYGAVLWPALLQTVDFRAPGLDVKGAYGVWELSAVGYLRIDRWREVLERVYVEQDDTGRDVPRLRSGQGPPAAQGKSTG